MSAENEQNGEVGHAHDEDHHGRDHAAPGERLERTALLSRIVHGGRSLRGHAHQVEQVSGPEHAPWHIGRPILLQVGGHEARKERGHAEIHQDVIDEERQRDLKRQADATDPIGGREVMDGADEGEHCNGSEPGEDDEHRHEKDRVVESAETSSTQRVRPLGEEDVKKDFVADVEDQAELDGRLASSEC